MKARMGYNMAGLVDNSIMNNSRNKIKNNYFKQNCMINAHNAELSQVRKCVRIVHNSTQ